VLEHTPVRAFKPSCESVSETTKTERWIRRTRMNQGAKDIRDYMNKSRTDAPNGPQGNEVEVRTRALSHWTSREQQQQKANVPKPRGIIGETIDKVASAVKGVSVGYGHIHGHASKSTRRKCTRSSDVFESSVNICQMVQSQRKPLSENAETSAYARHHEFLEKTKAPLRGLQAKLRPDTPASKVNCHWQDIGSGVFHFPANVRIAEGNMELWQGQRKARIKQISRKTQLRSGLAMDFNYTVAKLA
jgi:hypothetical protein